MNATKREVIEMFLDRTAGESTLYNRLTTTLTDSGNVALVAYKWLKIAEYDESRGVVTIFGGHKALNSQSVSRYLNDVLRTADDRGRDIVLSGESPTVDTPNEGTKYIGNYVDFEPNRSAVEDDAVEEVHASLTA